MCQYLLFFLLGYCCFAAAESAVDPYNPYGRYPRGYYPYSSPYYTSPFENVPASKVYVISVAKEPSEAAQGEPLTK